MEPLLVELPLVGLRLELEEPELVSGRGRVDVPDRVGVPGRDVSGRVDVLGRDVPGRVADEPGRKNYPDVSVHYADEWKYSDETGQNQSPNDDKSDILSDLSPGAVQSNG